MFRIALRNLVEIITGRRRRQARRNARAAGKLLSQLLGRPIELEIDRRFHSDTTRCRVVDSKSELPTEVIVKRSQDKGRRFDPDDPNPLGPAFRMFSEWASLDLIAKRFTGAAISPRVIAGDRDDGYLVVEVVGSESLHDLLCGEDRRQAIRGLSRYAQTLGRLHAASVEHLDDFRSLRGRLGPSADPSDQLWGSGDWFKRQTAELRDNFANLGFAPQPGFDQEMSQVAEVISAPEGLAALTHGDPCPDNLLFGEGEARLIDFEYCDIRHALSEGAYFRMLFPTTFQVNRLPDKMVSELEETYRSELVKGCPAVADRDVFERGILDGCVVWLTVTLASWSLQPPMYRGDRLSAIDADKDWGLTSNRQVALARLRAFVQAADRVAGYPALRATFAALEKDLLVRWPGVEEMPCYPAFRAN